VSNLALVWKKNGDIRLCVDFHVFNMESMKDNFPLPNMELILQQVAGSQMMSLSESWLRLMDSWYGLLVDIDVKHWRVIL
jgi:hypothetical protein